MGQKRVVFAAETAQNMKLLLALWFAVLVIGLAFFIYALRNDANVRKDAKFYGGPLLVPPQPQFSQNPLQRFAQKVCYGTKIVWNFILRVIVATAVGLISVGSALALYEGLRIKPDQLLPEPPAKT